MERLERHVANGGVGKRGQMAGRGHIGGGFDGRRSRKPAGGSSTRGETSTKKGSGKDSGKQTLPDCSKKGDDKHDDPAHPDHDKEMEA